jgi:hypothetical protein
LTPPRRVKGRVGLISRHELASVMIDATERVGCANSVGVESSEFYEASVPRPSVMAPGGLHRLLGNAGWWYGTRCCAAIGVFLTITCISGFTRARISEIPLLRKSAWSCEPGPAALSC